MEVTILSCASGFDYRVERIAAILKAVEYLELTGLPLVVLCPTTSSAQGAYDLLRTQHLQDKPSNHVFHLKVPTSMVQPSYCRKYIRAAVVVVMDFDSFLKIRMEKSYTIVVPILPYKEADMEQVGEVCDHAKNSPVCPIMYFFENEEHKKDRVKGDWLRRVLKDRSDSRKNVN